MRSTHERVGDVARKTLKLLSQIARALMPGEG